MMIAPAGQLLTDGSELLVEWGTNKKYIQGAEQSRSK